MRRASTRWRSNNPRRAALGVGTYTAIAYACVALTSNLPIWAAAASGIGVAVVPAITVALADRFAHLHSFQHAGITALQFPGYLVMVVALLPLMDMQRLEGAAEYVWLFVTFTLVSSPFFLVTAAPDGRGDGRQPTA